MENLRATGVAPEEINIVINSHLHFDHCGWNTVYKNGAAVATFPNAKILCAQRANGNMASCKPSATA